MEIKKAEKSRSLKRSELGSQPAKGAYDKRIGVRGVRAPEVRRVRAPGGRERET